MAEAETEMATRAETETVPDLEITAAVETIAETVEIKVIAGTETTAGTEIMAETEIIEVLAEIRETGVLAEIETGVLAEIETGVLEETETEAAAAADIKIREIHTAPARETEETIKADLETEITEIHPEAETTETGLGLGMNRIETGQMIDLEISLETSLEQETGAHLG